jgi:hypothetical protein
MMSIVINITDFFVSKPYVKTTLHSLKRSKTFTTTLFQGFTKSNGSLALMKKESVLPIIGLMTLNNSTDEKKPGFTPWLSFYLIEKGYS